jgi:di/tricarboxylate transporter
MTLEIGLLLVLILAAVFLFSYEKIPADVVALGILILLVLLGLVPIDKAFGGFGSDTVVLVVGLLVLTAAMERTGVMDMAARLVLRHTGTNPTGILLLIMVATTILSAFMSNTATTALLLPVAIGLARKAHVPASQLLMPMAFASIAASSLTLISTSTNLVINGLMLQYGMKPLGLFELTPLGLPIALGSLVYMFFIGRRLIPHRDQTGRSDEALGQRPYHTEVLILPTSPWVGKTLEQAALGRDLDLHVTKVVRKEGRDQFLPARASTVLAAGDVLLVEGLKENVLKIRDIPGIEIKSDVTMSSPEPKSGRDQALVEVILLPGHWLAGRSLRHVSFREHYGLQVLGIHRKGKSLSSKLGQVSLRVGDVLLVQGDGERISSLEHDRAFRILGPVTGDQLRTHRALLAISIFAGALALGTLNVVPLTVAVLMGVVLMFLTRSLTPEEAYSAVEWKVIVLIGSMLGLGVAMEVTGTAKYLAGLIVHFAGEAGPVWLLGGFFLFTVLLTQPMSNQAAAVVVFPVAYQTAMQLGLSPRSFAMMIAVAASCSFLTPLEPSCLMVYGPGRYRFLDFPRVGLPLTVVIFALALWLVPRIWPLR